MLYPTTPERWYHNRKDTIRGADKATYDHAMQFNHVGEYLHIRFTANGNEYAREMFIRGWLMDPSDGSLHLEFSLIPKGNTAFNRDITQIQLYVPRTEI